MIFRPNPRRKNLHAVNVQMNGQISLIDVLKKGDENPDLSACSKGKQIVLFQPGGKSETINLPPKHFPFLCFYDN